MSKFQARHEPHDKQQERTHNRMCCAANCPLPGTFYDGTNAADAKDWRCRFHFRSQNWDGVTQKLLQGLPLIRFIENLKKQNIIIHRAGELRFELSKNEFETEENENTLQYIDRLNNFLKDRIDSVIKAHKQQQAGNAHAVKAVYRGAE